MARHIGQLFDKVARKALMKHGGQLMAELARVWPELCPEVAGFTRPEAVKRSGPGPAVLKLRVEPARALEVQMLQPQLLARVNAHFGRQAFARIALIQAPVAADGAPAAPAEEEAQPDAVLLAELRKGLDNVRDAGLRASLEKVAEGIARRAAARRHGK